MLRKSLYLIGLLIIITSCDCTSTFEGQVIDIETGRPINDAIVKLEGTPQNEYKTDSLGTFDLTTITRTCPNHTLIVSKSGYELFELKTKSNNKLLIKLKKIRN